MELKVTDITNYHCPRWQELPEIELYVDQVVSILEKNLSLFFNAKNSPFITSNMINNYVKQTIIAPPIKKRYNRSHLAHLFVICIFKKIMNISDIDISIKFMKKNYSVEDGYNVFCEELEKILKSTFDPSSTNIKSFLETDDRQIATLRAIITTFADSILVDKLISLR